MSESLAIPLDDGGPTTRAGLQGSWRIIALQNTTIAGGSLMRC